MDRRTYLGAVAGAGLAAFAGCSSTARGARGPPQVPDSALESGGWERVSEETTDPAFEQSVGPVTLTASTVTHVYEDAALRETIRERTLGAADSQLATFFASRLAFDPDLTELPVGREQVLAQIQGQATAAFESQLRSAGLEGIERAGEGTLSVESGAEATRTDYRARFPFEGFSIPLSADRELSISGGDIPVAGHLASWFADGSVLLAGGAYPAENFTTSVEKAPTDAIEVAVEVDLGLTPETYREELLGLIRQVE